MELLRTNDPVLISWIEAVLGDVEIEIFVLDEYVSAIEGNIAIFPKRIMVSEERIGWARAALIEANPQIAAELKLV